jgi:hypothetical protein
MGNHSVSDILCFFTLWSTDISFLSDLCTDLFEDSGARGIVVVKSLSYKSEGRGFDTRSGELFQFT